ncbi:MAG: hypothetical protein IT521_16805 [Burkholderiales bacterium]|nr:hypothetical protein [Burkholderiales bacterium]
MNTLHSTLRGWWVWIVPIALLAMAILWQVDWGRALLREPPAESATVAPPLTLKLLPELRPAATADGQHEAVLRTLFNPTRRPAPTALAQTATPRMQRGQFALSGTLMVDGKAIAFLRETAGGKSRRILQGETINGMVVAEIRPDRVRLTLGEESEELALKLATGPKTTVQPVVAGAAGRPISTGAMPTAAVPPATPPAVRNVADVLAERRRAARAAEVAAQGLPPGAPIPVAPSAPVAAPTMPAPSAAQQSADPAWQDVYRRYQQPRR